MSRERLDALLRRCCAEAASDVHLTADEPAVLRIHGVLEPVGAETLSGDDTRDMAYALFEPGQREAFEVQRSIDLAYALDGVRFRINVFMERGRVALSIRRLDERLRSLEELGLPEDMGDLAELDEGMVLVVGPTGSGKSTTLATLIDRINQARPVHVVTLEDPIEYLHRSRRALIRQRQLHSDFTDFAGALRAALREDPDVILVGEMRDTETLRAALMASETGHLVFSTLHANSAVGAAERFVGAFAQEERDAVRHQLSHVLRAVVSQRLLPRVGGEGRAAAVEVLRVTLAVANSIRTAKPAQVASAMESGATLGMHTYEASLADLVARGLVNEERARRAARQVGVFEDRLRRARVRVRV